MLLAAYVGAFLDSVSILAAFAHVRHGLLEDSAGEIDGPTPIPKLAPVAVEPEVRVAVSRRCQVGSAASGAVPDATSLGSSADLLRLAGAP